MWPRLFAIDYRDVAFCPATLGHPAGSLYGLRLSVLVGGKLVLMDRWRPAEAIKAITREGCTHMTVTPTFLEDLIATADLSRSSFRHFRYAFVGGGRIRPTLVPEFEMAARGRVLRGFGMSEHFFSTMMRPYDDRAKRATTDGRCLPGVECGVLDEDGRRVRPGELGEIAYKGPALVDGYFTSAAETTRAFVAGWQLSGDLGQIDSDGYLTVVDRKKDLIIRGGENISPLEIENVLLQHPLISEVAVVGYSDDRLGERICAVVKPIGEAPTLESLSAFLADHHVARHKHPERIALVQSFPRTELGKIRKQPVKKWLNSSAAENIGSPAILRSE
jgi:cyclohexanecarboxylate-CoA ligase